MRLWSIHPKYLDGKGLVALWREALLAQKVLYGETKGYRLHPQLDRFKEQYDPWRAIRIYLIGILDEALARGYHFNADLIRPLPGIPIGNPRHLLPIPVTQEQLAQEFEHLKKKLARRCPEKLQEIEGVEIIQPHPLFVSAHPSGLCRRHSDIIGEWCFL